ncbi:GspE/PulE family protein [Arcobacter porcinus]|uniref:Type II secretion/transformation system, E protein n=1 Tax=Arcobacter porcinus TaxID=1935204 RepID=A0A5C2HDG9_9BACT|nr:GspE/PulE family protein [Arcobacter porcinus]OCL94283.1 putative type II secretion system protein E [Aliarcobacter thereius]QEP40986.1 type II secretion/transformation system, E protein [Arcobacter porcinus]
MNILKIKIDYSLFSKYGLEVFLKHKIVPIIEDSVTIKLAVYEGFNQEEVKDSFIKHINFVEFCKNEIEFILVNIETRVELFNFATSSNLINNDSRSTANFLDKLIVFSVLQRASDIHIEKFEDLTLFKFRVDGRLQIFFSFCNSFFKVISSYIKLICNLDMTQSRIPLDGRFSREISSKKYDFRFSSMPTIEAESIVLRVLDNKNIDKSLNDLGFSKGVLLKLRDILKLNSGLILISGPTGSGKTTTLYSILQELKSENKKIITVEDPVEYKISSINQISINNKIGLSFELVLKNILRQDPDIIFIGEIRDKFSLDVALQASLTGHLVLATVHSNSALETITRLIDLKADSYLISTSLKASLAQRLVLSYCKYCEAKGCVKCNFTKYYERVCISEVLLVDEKISSLIYKKSSKKKFMKYLKEIEFKTMYDDGLEKIENSQTSFEELERVVSKNEEI